MGAPPDIFLSVGGVSAFSQHWFDAILEIVEVGEERRCDTVEVASLPNNQKLFSRDHGDGGAICQGFRGEGNVLHLLSVPIDSETSADGEVPACSWQPDKVDVGQLRRNFNSDVAGELDGRVVGDQTEGFILLEGKGEDVGDVFGGRVGTALASKGEVLGGMRLNNDFVLVDVNLAIGGNGFLRSKADCESGPR